MTGRDHVGSDEMNNAPFYSILLKYTNLPRPLERYRLLSVNHRHTLAPTYTHTHTPSPIYSHHGTPTHLPPL